MTTQMSMFSATGVGEPEPTTEVRLGKRSVQYPLRKKRREACNRLMEILEELEGKDIHIGIVSCWGRPLPD